MEKTKEQAVLDQALHNVEFDGLSKEEGKAINAYNNAIQQGLAIFQGNTLKPTTKVSGDTMEDTIADLIAEDQKALLTEFKNGFRLILKDKIKLDNAIKEKRREFNKAVVEEKKAFTQKANKVLGLVDGINQLRADYMAALATDAAVIPETNSEESE